MKSFNGRIFLFTIIFLLALNRVYSQPLQLEIFLSNQSLSRHVPKTIQSTRSAVIISMQDQSKWKTIGNEANDYFKKISIDPVMFINATDLFANSSVTESFSDQFAGRRISNLIFITERKELLNAFSISLVPFDPKVGLGARDLKGWTIKVNELKDGYKILANDLIKAELENTNFLIPESPNFEEDTNFIKGTIYSVYSRDLRARKLAIPKYKVIDEQQLSSVKAYNQKVATANKVLEDKLASYPYEFGFVDTEDEAELYRQRYEYVLLRVKTTGEHLKKWFNLDVVSGETEYVSINQITKEDATLERINIDQVVYKYYVKHLVSGDVYIGDKWDTAVTWEQALENYINNMTVFTAR